MDCRTGLRTGGRKAIAGLDFHHASEPLWAVAHVLHGEGTMGGSCRGEPLRQQLRQGQEGPVVQTREALLGPAAGRRAATRTALPTPVKYRGHIHYQPVAQPGCPMGSGWVESLCRPLQDRFQRTGPFWSSRGLRHLMAVEVRLRNNDYDVRWN